jgi:hypothetical protein
MRRDRRKERKIERKRENAESSFFLSLSFSFFLSTVYAIKIDSRRLQPSTQLTSFLNRKERKKRRGRNVPTGPA